jgi:catechol 2,3-dioxygenase-like lactoylglutathione lyase family enzyme
VAIALNHMIVPARDKEASAQFYERMLGFVRRPAIGPFAAIEIPGQALTLDFDDWETFEPSHYAFKVSEAEFDVIFGRIVEAGLVYGSAPFTPEDMKTNRWNGGRGVYFRDPSGHLLELLTRDESAS